MRGIVQGVGFRPFVYTLARRLALAGHVGNNSSGVFIEVEGDPAALEQFRRELRASAPPLAMIDTVTVEDMLVLGEDTFAIVESEAQPGASTPISPDICLCDDCRRELFDPADRRYRYPFINCTNCGPRFTIIRGVPYDRLLTTMAAFPMCPRCAAEYHDPANRRFHAQPNACPLCGPRVLWWPSAAASRASEMDDAAIRAAQAALRAGKIVAVKGIGGFHLACDAANDEAILALRARKGRVDKPFAVMARDLAAVRAFADVGYAEAALLTGKERPIVLLRRQESDSLGMVAPGNAYVGVMLPYSPLHELLLDGLAAPLVMTSGNLSDEPIVKDNAEALARLAGVADAFLMHDRDIHVWCDDSVVRVFEGRELPLRRSRGYAPFPIKLAHPGANVLATGGELKATFCLAQGDFATMSQHIGDMENLETLAAFERAVAHFEALFRAAPERVACDMHPGYLSTRWAEDFARTRGVPLLKVQHHHAHIASAAAEHGRAPSERVIGLAFDGTGYGLDGAIWGGEVLLADSRAFERFAQLKYVPLPGGDAAIKRPYRTALAHLWAAGLPWDDDLPCVAACPPEERRVLQRQLERNLNCVPTSSMGRLFDAIAALIGVRQTVTYEAQAAIEMEALAEAQAGEPYPLDVIDGAPVTIDPAPLWRAIAADLRRGEAAGRIAARAHAAVAEAALALCLRARARSALNVVCLSGGVFQNVLLLGQVGARLRAHGFEVLSHRRVPPNDGGLALGQAMIGRMTDLTGFTGLTG